MRGCYVEELTWPEAERAIERDRVVVLPVGARSKQHGLHLPLNNDFLLAEYLARRVVEASPVLLLPTLPYGFYPAFVEYPGSVSLELETFRRVVVEVCRSFARHGARRFYALNTGLSTLRALEPAAQELEAQGVLLRSLRLDEGWGEVADEVASQAEGTHADEIETSAMLYVASEVVRLSRAQRDVHPLRGRGPFTRDPNAKSGRYSPTGAYGDPTLATRDKGRRLVEALVAHARREIEELANAELPAQVSP